jgi:putative aldouronate transport system substrate-binding protein
MLLVASCGSTATPGTQGTGATASSAAQEPGATTSSATQATTAPAATTAAQEPGAATSATAQPPAGQPAAAGASDKDPKDGVLKPEPIPAGMFPLTKQKVTLRIAAPSNASIEDINTNEFTKWYEKQTNVHIQWILLPENEARDKLNLMLSSGDLPDAIMGFYNISPAQLQVYGQQGIFIPLNDLIEKYGPNIKNGFAQYPLAKEVSTAPDGKIYGLPEINDCYHCSMSQKLWIYKPWLDKLGLKIPETTEELYQVLKAFKEKDPNGNGKADEIPLTTQVNGWNSNYDAYFMNSFLLNPADRRVLKNGKIDVTYNKPEWREGLRYLRRLAKDGLLDVNSFTQSGDQLKRLGQNDPAIVGSVPGGTSLGLAPVENKEGARWSQYVTVPPLKGPSGFRVQPFSPYAPITVGRFIITKAAKNPEIALRWADGFYQQEVEMDAYWGLQGKGWRWAKEGEKGIHGKQALYKQLLTWGNTQNDQWSQTNVSFRSSDWRLGQISDNPWELETVLYRETKKLEPYQQDTKMAVPPLYFTTEQAQEGGELEAALTKYVDEMEARFVTGDADIEKGWDTYVQTLEQTGLPRYLELQQAAYDAKYKK